MDQACSSKSLYKHSHVSKSPGEQKRPRNTSKFAKNTSLFVYDVIDKSSKMCDPNSRCRKNEKSRPPLNGDFWLRENRWIVERCHYREGCNSRKMRGASHQRIRKTIDQLSWRIFCIFIAALSLTFCDACATTKPLNKLRPPRPEWPPGGNSPNVDSSKRENCTQEYDKLFCLNAGHCYVTTDIGLPHCNCTFIPRELPLSNPRRVKIWATPAPTPRSCPSGYIGRRCEYAESPERFEFVHQQQMETAAISAAVTLLVVVVFLVASAIFVYRRRRSFPLEYVADDPTMSSPVTPTFAYGRSHAHNDECCSYATSNEGAAHYNRGMGAASPENPSPMSNPHRCCRCNCPRPPVYPSKSPKNIDSGVPDRPPVDASTPIDARRPAQHLKRFGQLPKDDDINRGRDQNVVQLAGGDSKSSVV